MDKAKLTNPQFNLRMNIRNFCLPMDLAELKTERRLSLERGDKFRAACIDECIAEEKAELNDDWNAAIEECQEFGGEMPGY